MDLSNSKRIMVVRYTPFRKYNFIKEHCNIIKDNGSVWMLKVGRKIPDAAVKDIIHQGGNVILKEPKLSGGRYYYAHCTSSYQGLPIDDMRFPEYYRKIPREDYDREPLDGTWLRIDEVCALDEDVVNCLYLCSNNRKLCEVVSQTRTSIMYVYYKTRAN